MYCKTVRRQTPRLPRKSVKTAGGKKLAPAALFSPRQGCRRARRQATERKRSIIPDASCHRVASRVRQPPPERGIYSASPVSLKHAPQITLTRHWPLSAGPAIRPRESLKPLSRNDSVESERDESARAWDLLEIWGCPVVWAWLRVTDPRSVRSALRRLGRTFWFVR